MVKNIFQITLMQAYVHKILVVYIVVSYTAPQIKKSTHFSANMYISSSFTDQLKSHLIEMISGGNIASCLFTPDRLE